MRTITIEKTVFTFEELSEKAKEAAQQQYAIDLDSYWSDYIVDDAKTIGQLMGWHIDDVFYSGFWNQGDGACFTGSMGYAKGCAKAVKSYAPTDTELQRIAREWQALQKRNFYALTARVAHSGHYSHEMCTVFDCNDDRNRARDLYADGIEDSIKEIARDFMRWIYKQLEKEYEYQTSAENVAEMSHANNWEYTENGRLI